MISPEAHADERGSFFEWYRADALEQVLGHALPLVQANCSVSRRGVIRGVHYADVPPGQAKYVICLRGAILDVIVDLRVGSPAFGSCHPVRLDDEQHRAVYLAEGLGHAFCALTDSATVSYLCSAGYTPAREHAVHPLDEDLALPWPSELTPVLSARDAQAPTLAEALESGTLPRYADCLEWYAARSTDPLPG